MNYPEILLLPVLMFSDYFLTILGSIQRDKKHSEHFKLEHYELNPVWQKSVAQKKWFNIRHILWLIFGTTFLSLFFEFGDLPDSFVRGIFGALFVSISMIVGRHLSNILIFRYLIRRTNEISGKVAISHSLALSISMYQYLAVIVPITILVLFVPSPFAIGALTGAVFLFAVHLNWIRKYRKKLKEHNKAIK